jgi:hypothetical protein
MSGDDVYKVKVIRSTVSSATIQTIHATDTQLELFFQKFAVGGDQNYIFREQDGLAVIL